MKYSAASVPQNFSPSIWLPADILLWKMKTLFLSLFWSVVLSADILPVLVCSLQTRRLFFFLRGLFIRGSNSFDLFIRGLFFLSRSSLPEVICAHASYDMNEYYQGTGRNLFDCNFGQTGEITVIDPSYGSCKYSSRKKQLHRQQ